jgi:predicted dinucleotide-binding enzyme
MRIAVIGAGRIGSTLVRRFTAAGHVVTVANSRGPLTLAGLAAETGATALPAVAAVLGADVVIVTIPVVAVSRLSKEFLDRLPAAAIVVDTGNYVPNLRDGQIPELDGALVESRWTEARLGHPVVKAFNNIKEAHLRDRATPPGTPGRIALPVSGDDPAARAVVMQLVDESGFDPFDAGGLDDSWRQQPGTPAYTTDLDRERLASARAAADPAQTIAWRERMRSPGSVALTRDFPRAEPPADEPGYREKFWVAGFDPSAGVGFSIWLETAPGDYSRWTQRPQVVAPGRLLRAGFESPGVVGADVGGQYAHGVCHVPLQLWQYGAAFTADEFDIAQLPETPVGRTTVNLDMRLTATTPAQEVIKEPGASLAESTFGTQYRQLLRAEGTVEIGGRPTPFSGLGFRARTTGPVAGGSFGGHATIAAGFPSGRGVLLLRQIRPDRTFLVDWAVMIDGERTAVATIERAPLHLTEVTPLPERFTVVLSSELGEWTVSVETVAPMLVVDPGYFVAAARSEQDRALVRTQPGFANNIAFARFRLDEETTYGVTERSARTNLLDGN